MTEHIPVLTEELLAGLHLKPQGTYLDATIGAGGHTRAFLAVQPTLTVVGLDRDPSAIDALGDLAREAHGRLTLVHEAYDRIDEVAANIGVDQFDGIVADLGFSSLQLADASRGFSYDLPGPLDLRFDQTEDEPAGRWLRLQSERDLAEVLGEYGELRRPHQLARKILDSIRHKSEIGTQDLIEASGIKAPGQLAKLFQAIRIAVNDELETLKRALPKFLAMLAPGGRLAIISFHSGEDRIVKHTFRAWQQTGHGTIITKRPLRTTEAELQLNRRARSAKLRIFERKEDTRADHEART